MKGYKVRTLEGKIRFPHQDFFLLEYIYIYIFLCFSYDIKNKCSIDGYSLHNTIHLFPLFTYRTVGCEKR